MHEWMGWTEVPSLPRVPCLGAELHANTSLSLSCLEIWIRYCSHFMEGESESFYACRICLSRAAGLCGPAADLGREIK